MGARFSTSVIAYHRVRVQPDRLSAGAPGLVSLCHLRAHRLPARLFPLPPLRSRGSLLLRAVYAAGASGHAAGRRTALPGQSTRAAAPRGPPSPLSRPPAESDASDFPAPGRVRHRPGAAPRSGERRAEIRRLYYAEHWRIGTIATTLGVHHDTVRHAIERFIRPGAQIRPTTLDPYKPFLVATLEQYLRLRATRLYVMIRERGFAGSAVQVRRWVRTVRPAARAEAYLRLETLPGEQGQVDWGNFGPLPIGRGRRMLSCFVLVLSWSRAVYARFALDQTLESFLRGHVEAFAALGGAPRTILYDNLKSVVLDRAGAPVRAGGGRRMASRLRPPCRSSAGSMSSARTSLSLMGSL